MQKTILSYSCLIILSFFLFASCKKRSHDLNPYPTNTRIQNFNKVITNTPGPLTGGAVSVIDENYGFIYDQFNRVTQIIYTTNDPLKTNLVSYLVYSNDTIYDTIKYVNNTIKEIDTFATDLRGNIITTFIQGAVTQYSYLNNLLTRVNYPDALSDNYYIYNSYDGYFTKSVYSLDTNKNLNYTFYTSLPNRPGDYLQLNSLEQYGYNFYQNSDLIWSIKGITQTANVTYVMDANNQITQTTADILDTSGAKQNIVYTMQYQTYK